MIGWRKRLRPAVPVAPAWLTVTALYLLITLAVTFPLAIQLSTHLAGEDSTSSDARESVWGVWWWRRALLDLRQNPLEISVLSYPDGQSYPLYPLWAQSFLLALPVAAVASPIVAYNVTVLASFVLSALTGYFLCTELSGDARAGFVGGLIWAFFPARVVNAVAGHLPFITLFTVPLAALALRRLLATPTFRTAGLAALAFIAAATMHPSHLPYVVAPLGAGLLIEAAASQGRPFWSRERLVPLVVMAGLTAAGIALLAYPALSRPDLNPYGPNSDVISFSPDLLAYFVPSSDHPLLQAIGLRDFAVKVQPYQYPHLIYLGWLPLTLAVVGARARRAEARVWAWLAIVAGVLALGPLLKIGGDFAQVNVGGEPYRIVMPYALIGGLPLLSWSRTPGRLTVLVMLAAAVLAAYGVGHALKRRELAARALWVTGAVSLVILFEYIVRAPFPTFPASAPAPVAALRAEADGLGALQLPVNGYRDNQRMLEWQTLHQHPLVGGRVYRDVPEAELGYDFFRRLLAPSGAGLVPTASDEARLGTLAAARLGWVLYDSEADPSRTWRALLEARLGMPLAEDAQAALFRVPAPARSLSEEVWELGPGWEEADSAAGGRSFCGHGVLYLLTPGPGNGHLAFTADPGSAPRQVRLLLNGQAAAQVLIGGPGDQWIDGLALKQGLNILELVDTGWATPGAAPAAPCQTAEGQPRAWGPTISKVRLLGTGAAPPLTPGTAVFGGVARLAGFAIPPEAAPGGSLAIRLIWRAVAPAGENLTAFVHLIGPDGTLAAQHDSPPVEGLYPTSQWATGEIIAYNIDIALPSQLAPGLYQLQLGLYRRPSLERVQLDGTTADTLTLGAVTIKP